MLLRLFAAGKLQAGQLITRCMRAVPFPLFVHNAVDYKPRRAVWTDRPSRLRVLVNNDMETAYDTFRAAAAALHSALEVLIRM